jgi:hypothetical protein
MATHKELKDRIIATSHGNAGARKCNLCENLQDNIACYDGNNSGICTVYQEKVPDSFIEKINQCKHWKMVHFDDPIPF